MNGFKNLFASKAIITTLVGAIFALLQIFGVTTVDGDLQNGIITVLFTLAGFFRFTATEQLVVGSAKT